MPREKLTVSPNEAHSAPMRIQPNVQTKSEYYPIKPDGFHSSASDKALQARYGHTTVQYNLAPPPTAAQLGLLQAPNEINNINNNISFQPTYTTYAPGSQIRPSYLKSHTPPPIFHQNYNSTPLPPPHLPPAELTDPAQGLGNFLPPNPQIVTFSNFGSHGEATVIDASSSSNSVL
jgi:hypothetical protein